jgi:hypothetical protein
MLLTIIAIFFICWAPKTIMNLMQSHHASALFSDAAFYMQVYYAIILFRIPLLFSVVADLLLLVAFYPKQHQSFHLLLHVGQLPSQHAQCL